VADKPKIIYHVSLGDDTVSGMFDQNGKLLDYWHDNDATWRDEYFAGFMKALGIKVLGEGDMKDNKFKGFQKALREAADPNGEWSQ
jgi:hypothetical protein